MTQKRRPGLLLFAMLLSLLPLSAQAEMYIAGQSGVTLPNI